MAKMQERQNGESLSSYMSLFSMFDKAGVSQESKWRSLILYFREMKDYTHLSDVQKAEIQALLTATLASKDYSDERLQHILNEYHNIIISPYKKRIEEMLRETSGMINSFQSLMKSRCGDIQNLEDITLSAVEAEDDEHVLMEKLRGAFHDVKELLETDIRSLELLASKDSLTGIANRRAFDSFMAESIVQWQTKQRNMALALFDIDFFKRFNDEHGHRIGDQVLIVVGKQLTQCIQSLENEDSEILAARYGGEEFALVVSGPYADNIAELAEKVRQSVKNFNFLIRDAQGNVVENGLHITISGGVANIWPKWNGAYFENLVDSADKALYHAKQAGRDRVGVFTPDRNPSYSIFTKQ